MQQTPHTLISTQSDSRQLHENKPQESLGQTPLHKTATETARLATQVAATLVDTQHLCTAQPCKHVISIILSICSYKAARSQQHAIAMTCHGYTQQHSRCDMPQVYTKIQCNMHNKPRPAYLYQHSPTFARQCKKSFLAFFCSEIWFLGPITLRHDPRNTYILKVS